MRRQCHGLFQERHGGTTKWEFEELDGLPVDKIREEIAIERGKRT